MRPPTGGLPSERQSPIGGWCIAERSASTTEVEYRPNWWRKGEDPSKIASEYQADLALAARLRQGGPAERGPLYALAYEEVLRRSLAEPAHRARFSAERRRRSRAAVRGLRPYLKPDMHFVEIGAGDCAVSFAVARSVRAVTAMDVRPVLTRDTHMPGNVTAVVSNGTGAPLEPSTIDLAFSDQLIEHLHPKDAQKVHRDLFNALRPGGAYICLTPNRLLGPHDLTRYFNGAGALGLHLKEYGLGELTEHLAQIGFCRITPLVGGGGFWLQGRVAWFGGLERLMECLTPPDRAKLLRVTAVRILLRALLGARIIAFKP